MTRNKTKRVRRMIRCNHKVVEGIGEMSKSLDWERAAKKPVYEPSVAHILKRCLECGRCPEHCPRSSPFSSRPTEHTWIEFEGSPCDVCERLADCGQAGYMSGLRERTLKADPSIDPAGSHKIMMAQMRTRSREDRCR